MPARFAAAFLLSVLFASTAMAATLPVSTPIMPLSEVRPGMVATVRTIFEGTTAEEFQAEIIGVMDNYLGPKQSLILARLKGPRVEFTGVVAGMSGSPVTVDGKLIGALSYRLGNFAKEPIAGITPIEYMLALEDYPNAPAVRASAAMSAPPDLMPAGMTPIETPLLISGVPAAVLKHYSADLSRLGLGEITAGGAASRSREPGADQAGSGQTLAPLKAGDAVAAALVTGDVALAATGTVTLVDGNRVLAFGHPALMNGSADFPMARAEIYLTLPSLQNSTKLSRVTDIIGTFHQSRLPAIAGEIGPKPPMIPVTVKVAGEMGRTRTFHYEVFEHRELTPALLGIVIGASLGSTPDFSDEMSLQLSGRISVAGHADVVINDLYSGFTADDSAVNGLAGEVQGLFAAVFQNRWGQARVGSVDIDVKSIEHNRLTLIEGVYPSRREMKAGDTVDFRVLMRPYRGEPFTKTFSYTVPDGEPPGPLVAYIGGVNVMNSTERPVLARQASQLDSLDQLILLLNSLRTSDKLYFKVTRRYAGAVVQNEILPALPPSIFATLNLNRNMGEVTPLQETTIHEEQIPLNQIIVGGTAIPLIIH